MNTRDVMLWALAGAVVALSIAFVLLGAGCRLYEPPCPCRASQAGGVSVQFVELADIDGGC